MSDLRLVIAGAGGRMGRTLVRAIADTPGTVLAGTLESAGSPLLGRDAGELAGLGANGVQLSADADAALAAADVVIDFTVPEATRHLARRAAALGKPLVIGTTGLSADDLAALQDAARGAAIVRSGNMSLGVNLLAALVRRVARTLDDSFDIEIMEMHHKAKVDAPSGTALMFGEAAATGRNVKLADKAQRGRDGITGARKAGDIGFASLRGGSVVGDHTVIFAGPAERIELSHRAEDRMIFARGAIKAAQWVTGRPPGLYNMADVLGLSDF